MENIFEITDLICKYQNNTPVLKVDSLNITKGEMTLVIGLSGAGKSTFLETLGLMNNTLANGSSVKLHTADVVYDYDKLWQRNNQALFSELRRKYFSFVFQNTNLMPNFTIYDNICITQIIQGQSKGEAIKKAKKMMEILGLDHVSTLKKAYELSGGERQRVAFARAIIPKFLVLFGDEPTGNLDEYNSLELMHIIKKSIANTERSAIIVSHNIDLAIGFADKIVLITKEKGLGHIKTENIFQRKEENTQITWANSVSSFDSMELKTIISTKSNF